MSRGFRQLMRIARLVLAVALLWIATAPSAGPVFDAWAETACLIAPGAQAEEPSDRTTPFVSPKRAHQGDCCKAPKVNSTTQPAARHVAVGPDLYLRNCAFLC